MTTKFWGKIISRQESYASQTTNQVRRSSKDIFRHIGSFFKKKYSLLESFRKMCCSQTTRVQEQRLQHRKEAKRIPGWHWRQQTVLQSEITMHPLGGVEWKAPREVTSSERNYYFMCLNGTKRVLQLQWNIWKWIIDRHIENEASEKASQLTMPRKEGAKEINFWNTVTQPWWAKIVR